MKINRRVLVFCLWSVVYGLWSIAYAAPTISNAEIVTISDTTAVISWQTTNEASTGSVRYAVTLPVSSVTEETGTSKYHYLTLSNLFPNTTYYYKVYSKTATATSEGELMSFKTLERPSGNYLFTFATLSDLHYSPNQANTTNIRGRPYNSSEAVVDALVSAINNFSPAFTIIKGDVLDAAVNTPNTRVTELKTRLDSLTSAGAVKYYPLPGNHDKGITYTGGGNWVTSNLGVLYPAGAGLSTGDSTFNYSFVYSGYRFIMLDSLTNTGTTAAVNITSLEAELVLAKANKQKAFIFMHSEASEESDIPSSVLAAVLDQDTFTDSDWNKIRINNRASFFSTLKSYKLDNGEPVVAGIFMGHIHDNMRRDFEGIPCVRTSSGLQFPTGYNIYKVYSNGFVQSYYKLPGYSEEISRALISATGEVSASRAQTFYLGGLTYRNFTYTYSSSSTNVAPTVHTLQPAASATGVALNQPIIIDFTKAMVTTDASWNSWLSISPSITTSKIWNSAGTRLTVTPSSPLAASTVYTVSINSAAAATDSTTFGTTYTATFTTGTQASSTAPSPSILRLKNESGTATDVTTDPSPTFSGIVTDESGSTVASVECRYASTSWSSWQSATPSDGSFNSAIENFTFTITNEVARGAHELQLRATNAAGITTTATFPAYSFYVIGSQPQITLQSNGSTIINGDPINSTPSLEITVITDQTLSQLWLTIDTTRINILPASVSYVTRVSTKPTLTAGTHSIKIEALDSDIVGATRISTKEAVNLLVQTSGDLSVYGTPLNYPNPFNAGTENTNLSYNLSKNSDITLTIHDLSGALIVKKTYTSGNMGGRAGYNEVAWDGKADNGNVVGNGIYVYILIAEGKVAARGKLMVVKR